MLGEGREVWSGRPPHKEARLSLCQVNSILASDMSIVSSSLLLALEFILHLVFILSNCRSTLFCEQVSSMSGDLVPLT